MQLQLPKWIRTDRHGTDMPWYQLATSKKLNIFCAALILTYSYNTRKRSYIMFFFKVKRARRLLTYFINNEKAIFTMCHRSQVMTQLKTQLYVKQLSYISVKKGCTSAPNLPLSMHVLAPISTWSPILTFSICYRKQNGVKPLLQIVVNLRGLHGNIINLPEVFLPLAPYHL